jgi:single-stranded DNA-binding protein
MKIGVSLKINVMEIEKARLFQGKKGDYLDATIFIDVDEKDQYGNNGMITQDVSKDEKAQGVKGNILGNGSIFWSDNSAPQQRSQPQQPPAMDDFDDDIPF